MFDALEIRREWRSAMPSPTTNLHPTPRSMLGEEKIRRGEAFLEMLHFGWLLGFLPFHYPRTRIFFGGGRPSRLSLSRLSERRKSHIWWIASQMYFIPCRWHSCHVGTKRTESEREHTQSPWKRNWEVSGAKKVLIIRGPFGVLFVCFFCFNFLLELIYNVLFISAVQQSVPGIHMCTFSFSYDLLPCSIKSDWIEFPQVQQDLIAHPF